MDGVLLAMTPIEQILTNQIIDLEEFADDLKALAKTPGGRNVLWVLLIYSDVFGSDFAESPYRQAYNAGKRDVGIFLMGLLDSLDSDILAIMREDARRRLAEEETQNEESDDVDDMEIYQPDNPDK